MLPAYGEVRYNGYDFPATYKCKLNTEIVYASDEHTVKYHRNTLRVEFILTTENSNYSQGTCSVDNDLENIRRTITKAGQLLEFVGQGSGSVLSSDARLEPEGGPFPKIIEWEPIGTKRAANVVWECVFHTIGCSLSNTTTPILEFQYERTSDLLPDGTHTIMFDGNLHMGKGGLGQVIPTQTLIAYFSNLTKALFLPGGQYSHYKCTKDRFTLDRTDRKLEFSIHFERIKSRNPYFPGMWDVNASHEMSSELKGAKLQGKGMRSWTNSISAEITLDAATPSVYALDIFYWIMNQRFRRLKDAANQANNKKEDGENQELRPRTVLTSLRMKEGIYSYSHSFEAKYLGVYDRSDLLNQSGIFTRVFISKDSAGLYPWQDGYSGPPLVDSDWHLYHANRHDIRNKTNNLSSGLWANHQKIVLDPCTTLHDQVASGVISGGVELKSVPGSSHPIPPFNYDIVSTVEETPPVTVPSSETSYEREKSYAAYEVHTEIVEDTRTHMLAFDDYSEDIENFKTTTLAEQAGLTAAVEDFLLHGKKSGSTFYPSSSVVTAGESNYMIVLHGYAVRVGFPIPTPTIRAVGGTAVRRAPGGLVKQGIISRSDEPIYAAQWAIPYFVPGRLEGNVYSNIDSSWSFG